MAASEIINRTPDPIVGDSFVWPSLFLVHSGFRLLKSRSQIRQLLAPAVLVIVKKDKNQKQEAFQKRLGPATQIHRWLHKESMHTYRYTLNQICPPYHAPSLPPCRHCPPPRSPRSPTPSPPPPPLHIPPPLPLRYHPSNWRRGFEFLQLMLNFF